MREKNKIDYIQYSKPSMNDNGTLIDLKYEKSDSSKDDPAFDLVEMAHRVNESEPATQKMFATCYLPLQMLANICLSNIFQSSFFLT